MSRITAGGRLLVNRLSIVVRVNGEQLATGGIHTRSKAPLFARTALAIVVNVGESESVIDQFGVIDRKGSRAMTDLREQLTAAIEGARDHIVSRAKDAAAFKDPYAGDVFFDEMVPGIFRYGDLRAVAAAWDEHLPSCRCDRQLRSRCYREAEIETAARKLLSGEAG